MEAPKFVGPCSAEQSKHSLNPAVKRPNAIEFEIVMFLSAYQSHGLSKGFWISTGWAKLNGANFHFCL